MSVRSDVRRSLAATRRAAGLPASRLALLALATLLSAAAPDQPASAPTVLIQGARVFDGTRAVDSEDVLLVGGMVATMGKGLKAPAGATIVDGHGKTLLPGLIDSHVHAFLDAPRTALTFGVTTEMDMFTNPQYVTSVKADHAAGKRLDEADLFSAGTLATVPGGHGTEYGFPIPTLTKPEEAQAWVDARIKEGSDYIKIIIEDGSAVGLHLPTLDEPTVRALVEAAHKRGKLAVVHITTLAAAREALNAGADGLVHLFVDKADPEFAPFAKAHHAFVVPTLTVLEGVAGSAAASGASLVHDPHLAPYLTPPLSSNLERGFPRPESRSGRFDIPLQTVAQLKAAGVPILAGTDSPNPGTAHGVSLHRELELLVRAGLTPAEALAAATSTPATIFHLADRGRIAPGLRADLVLVDGDPTADILKTRAIVAVWKRGVPLNLAERRAEAQRARDVVAEIGLGWDSTTDAVIGGHSTATLDLVADRPSTATDQKKSLAVSGKVDPSGFYGWAGASETPSGNGALASDLSAKKALKFWAKGDGRTYQVMIFTRAHAMIPLTQPFVAGPEWKEITLPFSSFTGFDGKDLLSVAFAAVSPPGPYAFVLHGPRFE